MQGKPGRPQKYPNGSIKFLVPAPPRCICGSDEYTFTYLENQGIVRARCMKCRYDRYFNPVSQRWGPKK
jgi:hypothetical protein